jgi:hypothetical protein
MSPIERIKRARPSALTVLLAATQLLIAALIVGRLFSGTNAAELLAQRELAPSPAADDWSSPSRRDDTGVLEARPLFNPSRRLPSDVVAAVATEPARPSLRIVGTMRPSGRPAVGLLARDNGETLRVRLGDDVDGWVVHEITARTVVFTRGGEQFEVGAEDAKRVTAIASTAAERGDAGDPPAAPPAEFAPRIYRAPPQ